MHLLAAQVSLGNPQGHPDPFTQSSRLPDISVGFGAMINFQDRFEVFGQSALITADYYNFVDNYSLGIEYTRNLDRLGQFQSSISDPSELERAQDYEGLAYDNSIVALRAGKVINSNFILIGSLGLDFLTQYRVYRRTLENREVEEYFIASGRDNMLYYYKLSLLFKIRRIGLEAFVARRGVGATLHYYINQ